MSLTGAGLRLSTAMDFLLLGPMQAYRGNELLDLGRRGQRLVLGLLLLETGRPVSIHRLEALLWHDDPPANARAIIQTHVSRLRRLLDPHRDGRYGVRLLGRGSAYLVDTPATAVDVNRFRSLVERGLAEAQPAAKVAILREALGLWRGPLLADVADDELRYRIGVSLEELRLTAWEGCAEGELADGRHRQVIADLVDLVAANPTRESLVASLMLALYRDGRGPDALTAYHRTRRILAASIGTDPGPQLQQLYQAVLRADRRLLPSSAPVQPGEASVPAQLPADTKPFVGRMDELDELDRFLADDQAHVPIAVLVGTAGAGKTALALRWAHRRNNQFPDGQLYINLNAYGAGRPISPTDALARFLRALDVAVDRIPATDDEAAAMYRTLLANRRVLILLDNVAAPDQVRQLLPGSRSCKVLVTSRNALSGLVALEGAHRITVGMLAPAEACQLLGGIAGDDRVSAERSAAMEIVRLCAHLPLAVRIAAARLADDTQRPFSRYAAQLRSDRRLTALTIADDPQAAVRIAFAQSYLALAEPTRRLFRLLAMMPGTSFSEAAVETVTDTFASDAQQQLQSLVDAHLVRLIGHGRYELHDLIRLFARERAQAEETDSSRHAAFERILIFYRDAANAADRRLRPRERPSFESATHPMEFASDGAALNWFKQEESSLIAAVSCSAQRHPRLAWQIAAAMYGWLYRRHSRSAWISLYRVAAEAAASAGDAHGEALIVGRLAIAHGLLSQTDEALVACRRAYQLRHAIGDRLGAATALLNMAAAQINGRQPEDAIGTLADATIEAHGITGAGHFTTLVHSNLAEAHYLADRPGEALRHYELALAASNEYTGMRDQAQISISFAEFCIKTGDINRAVQLAERGMRLASETGDIALVAEAHERLGNARATLGDHRSALSHLYRAIVTYEQIGHRGTMAIRRRIAHLNKYVDNN